MRNLPVFLKIFLYFKYIFQKFCEIFLNYEYLFKILTFLVFLKYFDTFSEICLKNSQIFSRLTRNFLVTCCNDNRTLLKLPPHSFGSLFASLKLSPSSYIPFDSILVQFAGGIIALFFFFLSQNIQHFFLSKLMSSEVFS